MKSSLASAASANYGEDRLPLEHLLRRAIDGLARLNAEEMEALAELLEAGGGIEPPRTAAAWQQARAHHRVLAHLLGSTARQLSLLRRISAPPADFHSYSGQSYSG